MIATNKTGTTQKTQKTQRVTTRKTGFFAKIPREIIRAKHIRPATLYIYNVMADMADFRTHTVEARIETIADVATKSKRTITRQLKILEKLKLVIRIYRKDPHYPKLNMPSVYLVRGAEALDETDETYVPYADDTHYEPTGSTAVETTAEIAPETKMSKGLDKNGMDKYKRDNIRENNNITLTREAEKLPKDLDSLETAVQPVVPDTPKTNTEPFDLTGVPDVMRPTVKLLLFHTGRSSISADELSIVRKLADIHTPTRVNREILTCIERFDRLGRKHEMLTFNYLWSYLKHQNSLKAALSPKRKRGKKEKPPVKATAETEQEQKPIELTMPLEQAEKVLSEYKPEQTPEQEIPVALTELHGKILAKTAELTDQYVESLPKDSNGDPIWPSEEAWPSLTVTDYLELKFPEAEEEELRTDYYGVRESAEELTDYRDMEKALAIDTACAYCDNPDNCPLERRLGKGVVRPYVSMRTNQRGKKCVVVGYGEGVCKHRCKEHKDPEFERRLERSGITREQSKQTFERYECSRDNPELAVAKAQAILAAESHKSLVLAGKSGTGKTHLAIAIAIQAMRKGKQALFRTVPDLLDEIRKSCGSKDIYRVKQKFMEIPCLVLDDLGKEKSTKAGMEYLYQIIDYRYKYGMQTVITTNALDMFGLMNEENADIVEPLISRVLENGVWVTISKGENYRLKKPVVSETPVELETPAVSDKPETPAETPKLSPINYDDDVYDDDEDDLRLYGDTGITPEDWAEWRATKKRLGL